MTPDARTDARRQEALYRHAYFLQVLHRTTALQALAPLTLVLAGLADAWLTRTPFWSGLRGPVVVVGAVVLMLLLALLRRMRTAPSHGWTVIAMLCATELSLAFAVTPSRAAAIWFMPVMLAIPLAAAAFWVQLSRLLACCVLCYACAWILPVRAGVGAATALGFIGHAALFTATCVAIFRAQDRVRRGAHAMQQQLDHEARHDALTGLPTRRAFLRLGEAAVAASVSSGEPLCLAFIDLDDFKAVNDRHGHAAGDAALQRVAERLGARLLAGMAAARMGGEEFVLLLPGVALEAGAALVDALRQEVAADSDAGVHVTVSAGVTQLGPGESLAQLMMRADQAMLTAKGAGRDRVLPAPAR